MRHRLVVDILKSLPTYHLAYGAAFAHDTAGRLPLVRTPTLFLAADTDPLAEYLQKAAGLVPGSRRQRLPREEKAGAIRAFLDQ
jgi:hypothetical protein